MPVRAYYQAVVSEFIHDDPERILGILTSKHHHDVEQEQRRAWQEEISILKDALVSEPDGRVFLEFYIPRLGKRADAVLILGNVVFVVEFKIGKDAQAATDLRQVDDYALDLKNFHEGSHSAPIVPVLVPSQSTASTEVDVRFADDLVAAPMTTGGAALGDLIQKVICARRYGHLDVEQWMDKGYKPTPTIVEAAQVLYRTHSVEEITRSDASATNLNELSVAIGRVVERSRQDRKKAICFVTGVPGSGKTLAGLNIAVQRSEEHRDEHAVFLSGNGPLVEVLREALARDRARATGCTKKAAEREVHSFIQNIHHFRDHYVGTAEVPIERVTVFDEAQRAWTRHQAAAFMRRKRGQPDFDMSEPEFLIGVMDRHPDWCVIVCLVGGGQEINTGEAGISEWITALRTRFSHWDVFLSPRVTSPEYELQVDIEPFLLEPRVRLNDQLHLGVSIRSFRAERLSEFVTRLLEGESGGARETYGCIKENYPIFVTRDLAAAKEWLRSRARGTERFGIVASSGGQRLRAEGIYVKAEVRPSYWFLNEPEDVRSSYYLEDVATEFTVQGLELDWVGVCWDGDFYYDRDGWRCQTFVGTRWQSMRDRSRRLYLKNSYRVLLTRARQGMVIFVPHGDQSDYTRRASYYDGTFEHLRSCGISVLNAA